MKLFLYRYYTCFAIFVLIVSACDNHVTQAGTIQDKKDWPESFGFGRAAAQKEIDSIDIDIMPDGKGLLPGSGNALTGKTIYTEKCTACHGPTGAEGPFAVLVGVKGDTTKAKTIGNYWPYATTIFDYIRRTMPLTSPGSLSNDEVYSLTAYLLHANKIIDSTMVLNARNLASIEMPAKKYFVNDDRQGGPEIR